MPRYLLRTSLKKVEAPTEADVQSALAEIHSEDGVAVLEDEQGNFVQFDGRRLEYGDGNELYGVDLEGVAERAFAAFLRGERTRPETLSWKEMSDELEAERAKRRRYWRTVLIDTLVLVGLIGVAFVIGAILLNRATGAS